MAKIGKYEVVRLLATGGMAEVFLAKTEGALGFEKTVVVKKIRPHLMGDPQFLQMFLNEAKIAAQLDHPNIVQVFDFGEAEDIYYLAMEYIDGPNLRTLSAAAHKAGKPIPLPLCAKIISSTCEGLAYAHEFVNPETQQPLNIVHRDLSPDNVVIAKNGAVKVVDFGIAKAAEQLFQTQSGLRKGKLAYMAPEYLKGSQPDRRSDVFALGVVLYELISNKKPYDAENEITLMHAMIYDPMVPLRARRANVPEDLERIVNKALARDPGERYQSCRELQADLEQFVIDHGEPLSAIHISRAITALQPELEAAALAKTPNRMKSPPVAGTPPSANKTPPKKSTSPSGEKRRASGEKRSPSGEKRAGATPPRPVQAPPPPPEEEAERTIRMSGAELVAKAAAFRKEAALEQGLAGLRKDFDEKPPAYGEGDSSARTLAMPAVKATPIATPIRYPPAKPRSDRAKTEPGTPRVQLESAGKANPGANARAKASASAEPSGDLLKVLRQNAVTFAAVALALLLIGGGIAALVFKTAPQPSPPPEAVKPSEQATPPPLPPHPDPEPPPKAPDRPPPAPSPPQPTVPAGGTLEVTSNVPAWVKVDGKRVCRSVPCRSGGVRPSKHEVELVHPATQLWMKRWKDVEFKVGTPVKLDGQVARGTVKVSSPATGDAAVYVDGDKQPKATAPAKFELNQGLHHIRFESPKKPAGYEQDVVVEPGKEILVTARYP